MEPAAAAGPAAGVVRTPASVVVHVGFFCIGIATTALAPLLPSLAERWSLADARAGALFSAQFLGSICSMMLAGLLVARFGFRRTLVTGYVIVGAAVAALAFVPAAGALATVFCNGIGLGLAIPASNLYVAAVSRERPAAALNVLNFAWGLGAIAGPWLAAALGGANAFLLALAAAVGSSAVWIACVRFPQPAPEAGEAATPQRRRPSMTHIATVAGLFFLYVGSEAAVAGWIAAYAQRVSAPGSNAWLVAPSFFWAPFLAGRALAPAVLRRLSERTVMRAGLLLGAAGIALLLASPTFARIATAVAIVGLGFATIFPLLVAMIPRMGSATRIAGPIFAVGALGGATLPWVVGLISTRSGTLAAGLVAPLLAVVAMLGVHGLAGGEPAVNR